MAGSKRLREAAVVAGTLLAAIVALRLSARNPGELSTLDRGILRLVSPAQAAMSIIARAITGVAGRYVELTHVRAENDTLVRENSKLRTELIEMRRLAEESGRYQRLLGLRDVTPAETIAARVIAVDASPYFRVARVEIDRGDGMVRRGMPVLTPEGVVGRINRVSGKSSDVMLLVDPRSAIDVLIPRTGGRGILRGKSGENGYRCSIEYLARGEPAREGDAVVTSGLGGSFPRNLAVGHITHIFPGRGRAVPRRRGHARRRLRSPRRRAGDRGAAAGGRPRSRLPPSARPGPHGVPMRSAVTLSVAFLLLILQSTVLEIAPMHMVAPSLGLLVVLHVGLSSKWTVSSAAVVSFVTGYLFDLVSGAPQGVHAFVFVIMSLCARALATRVAVQGIVLGAAAAFVTSLISAALVVIVRAQVAPEGGYGGLRQAPVEALLTGICGPFVLGLFRRIDGKVDNARSRVGLARGPRPLGDPAPWK